MKITRIEPILVAIPYEHGAPKPLMSSGLPRATMDTLYVKVETDAGVTGWGEAFGFSACKTTMACIESALAPLAVGRDATDIAALMAEFHRRFQSMGRNGPAYFALAGLDMALWDIKGKVERQPIHKLLGGPGRTRIPAYASVLRTGGQVEIVKSQIKRALDRGYHEFKLHEKTVEAVEAARKLVGDKAPIMLDVNCAWDLDGAIDMAKKLAPYDLAWLEEPIYPCDDYEAMARLREATKIPVGAGEELGPVMDFRHMMDAGAVDIAQPDAIRTGGISGVSEVLDMAKARGLRGDPHSPYYGPGLIASIHLIAAMEEEIAGEFFFADLEASPIGAAIYPREGYFTVPQGPGLGIEVDEKLLEKYRVK